MTRRDRVQSARRLIRRSKRRSWLRQHGKRLALWILVLLGLSILAVKILRLNNLL